MERRTISVYQVDSFSQEIFFGNPASVVLDADGLTDREMQLIAREMNNSETAFVCSPDADDHDIGVRFFTPTIEVPSCGHATIAANYVLAKERNVRGTVLQKTQAGIFSINIVDEGDDCKIFMTQKKPEFLNTISGAVRANLLSALALSESDLVPFVPIQIVSTGHSKVLIPLISKKMLNSLRPDMESLKQLSKRIGCNGFFIFTLDSTIPTILAHARMFAPSISINEDPVTGNGNGPMGAYLAFYNMVPISNDRLDFKAMQGEAINRAGVIDISVKIKNDVPYEVTIGGLARLVFQTTLTL